MAKIIQHYQTSKLSVDHNRQHNDGTLFICSCFTPGATIDIEPEYLVKTVTYMYAQTMRMDTLYHLIHT
mgnify:CR=1 FL=1